MKIEEEEEGEDEERQTEGRHEQRKDPGRSPQNKAAAVELFDEVDRTKHDDGNKENLLFFSSTTSLSAGEKKKAKKEKKQQDLQLEKAKKKPKKKRKKKDKENDNDKISKNACAENDLKGTKEVMSASMKRNQEMIAAAQVGFLYCTALLRTKMPRFDE